MAAVESHPWDRLPAETARAFEAFQIYLELGPSRSLDETSRLFYGKPGNEQATDRQRKSSKTGRPPGQVTSYSRRFRWVERAAAYDAHIADLRRREAEKATKRAGRDWVERSDRQLEEDWALNQTVRGDVASKLEIKKVIGAGGKVSIQHPDVSCVELRHLMAVIIDSSHFGDTLIAKATGKSEATMAPAAFDDQIATAAERRLRDWQERMRSTLLDDMPDFGDNPPG